MKNTELLEFFLANRQRLSDHAWLSEALAPDCEMRRLGMRGGDLRALQHPDEIAWLCCFLAEQKIQSYLEIGVFAGGSFYIIDSYLRAAVDGFERSLAVDVTSENLNNWMAYQMKLETVEFRFRQGRDITFKKGEKFDAAFIDGRHLDKCVTRDFDEVKSRVKWAAFHDIEADRASVHTAWARIKQNRNHWEYVIRSTPRQMWMGMGVVQV